MFKTVKDGKLPTRGSKYSACVDLYAREDIVIGAGETKVIPLGVALDLEEIKESEMFMVESFGESYGSLGEDFDAEMYQNFLSSHYIKIAMRSSIAVKHGLIIANGEGIIDMDYEGEMGLIVHQGFPAVTHTFSDDNDGKRIYNPITIKKGDRVAQATLMEHKSYLFGIETEDERSGGFGSTGKC